MSEDNRDILTDHAYDGIQEYDNPTPGWWTWIFIATIVFSGIYFFISAMSGWQLGAVPFYERYVVANMQKQYGQLGELKPDAATILKLSTDEKWLKVASALYQSNCVTCHGPEGAGLSGPNLTDDSFLNVSKIEDIADVIAKGRNNGAMPAWSTRLQPVEIVLLSAYTASMRGKNLSGRPAEGKPIPAWSANPS